MIIKSFIPNQGWQAFKQTDALVEFLWQTLKLKEKNQGPWSYLSFTPSSSCWELNINDALFVIVSLQFDDNEKARELDFHVNNIDTLSSPHIQPIVKYLVDTFDFRIE